MPAVRLAALVRLAPAHGTPARLALFAYRSRCTKASHTRNGDVRLLTWAFATLEERTVTPTSL